MKERTLFWVTEWLASFIIAGVLLWGFDKVLYPADFARAVYRYHLLPDAMVNLVALYLTWLEIVCGICLLAVPRFRGAALWIALILLLGFTTGIGINLVRGTTFGCGCFSASPDAQPMNWLSVARNAGLILLVVLALVARRKAQTLTSQ